MIDTEEPEIDFARIEASPVWREEIQALLRWLRYQVLEEMAVTDDPYSYVRLQAKAQAYKELHDMPAKEMAIAANEREHAGKEGLRGNVSTEPGAAARRTAKYGWLRRARDLTAAAEPTEPDA